MFSELHPTLKRQLKKLGLSPNAAVEAEPVNRLFAMVSRAYGDFDQERYLLDRSQNIASDEMNALNTALKDSQARLSSLLSLSSDWVWEQGPDGRFTFVSEELEPRTGVATSTLLGQRCTVDGLLRVDAQAMERLVEDMSRRQRFRTVTFEVARDDGELRYMQITGEPVFVAGEFAGYRGVGSDVTASVQAAQRIEELARYDSLTGLPNRHMFMEELQRMLGRSERAGRSFAVMFIDLDRFKSINDTLGHSAGDELLQNIGRRLIKLLRKADVLARLGGDEFVVLTDDNPDAATLAKIACRVLSCINEPMQLEGRRVEISASVGIAFYPRDGRDEASLVQAADTAMYQAKAKGKNTFEFFTEDMARSAASNFALEGDLRLAVERQQLELHYQPKVDAGTGELIGMEALIRWHHPERGLLAPGAFVELAEESGLIVPIGRWVLRTACAQMAAWTSAGLAPPRCAVNISVRQIMGDTLISDVGSALDEARLDASRLEVEVTESLLMTDPCQAVLILEQLNLMGVHIAIDDFGTGYSSLAYLKEFPVRTLKIDRSFVKDLPFDTGGLAITRAVIAMGHSLDMLVVAEGIETIEQQTCLAAMGCDVLQGYYFGRPVDAKSFENELRKPRLAQLVTHAPDGGKFVECTGFPADCIASAP